jgi:hypothetical protein
MFAGQVELTAYRGSGRFAPKVLVVPNLFSKIRFREAYTSYGQIEQ